MAKLKRKKESEKFNAWLACIQRPMHRYPTNGLSSLGPNPLVPNQGLSPCKLPRQGYCCSHPQCTCCTTPGNTTHNGLRSLNEVYRLQTTTNAKAFVKNVVAKERTAMHAVLWNCGSDNFKSKDYETSAEMFEKSMLYIPHDEWSFSSQRLQSFVSLLPWSHST